MITPPSLPASLSGTAGMSGWFGRRAATAAPQPAQAAGSGPGGSSSSGTPLELIKWNQDTGKFELGAEALCALKQTRGPVGVVAVCGRARQVSGNATPSHPQAWANVHRHETWKVVLNAMAFSCTCRASRSSSTSCWDAAAASRSLPPTARAPRVRQKPSDALGLLLVGMHQTISATTCASACPVT